MKYSTLVQALESTSPASCKKWNFNSWFLNYYYYHSSSYYYYHYHNFWFLVLFILFCILRFLFWVMCWWHVQTSQFWIGFDFQMFFQSLNCKSLVCKLNHFKECYVHNYCYNYILIFSRIFQKVTWKTKLPFQLFPFGLFFSKNLWCKLYTWI